MGMNARAEDWCSEVRVYACLVLRPGRVVRQEVCQAESPPASALGELMDTVITPQHIGTWCEPDSEQCARA